MTRPRLLPIVLIVISMVVITIEWIGILSPGLGVVVVGFLLIAPGLAVLDIWRLVRGWIGVSMVLALNVALITVVATALAYTHLWSPRIGAGLLASLTAAAATVSVLQDRAEA
jgi:hypothetical protein